MLTLRGEAPLATATSPQPGPRKRTLRALVGSGMSLAVAAVLIAPATPAAARPLPIGGRTAVATTNSPALPESAPRVLVIGDSTTVHMLAGFQAALAAEGVDATVDAKSGRTTWEGRAVLAGYDLSTFDHVAVLLGANGNRDNAVRDMRALKRAGVSTMATVQAPRQRTVNRAVKRVFGADRIRWAGYAAKRGIRTTDGKHYTRSAYRARARYLARQIAQRVS